MSQRSLRLWRLGESRVGGRCFGFSSAFGFFCFLGLRFPLSRRGRRVRRTWKVRTACTRTSWKGQENAFVPKNLELMRQADLAWVRCDFYWDTVENPQGTWHFDHIEKVLDQTEARGLKLLVILGYTVPWARPVCDHPEPWLEYQNT